MNALTGKNIMAISPIGGNTNSSVVAPAAGGVYSEHTGVVGNTPHTAVPDTQNAINPTQDSAKSTKAPPSTHDIRNAAKVLNHLAESVNTSVSFHVDDSTGITVIKVIDTEKNQVIRQIPSEEVLSLSKAIDTQQGVVLKTKV